jgi:hypothetical protein
MRRVYPRAGQCLLIVVLFLLFFSFTSAVGISQEVLPHAEGSQSTQAAQIFRLERAPVAGGAELVTIHARLDGLEAPEDQKWVPLVTVLRDTLGDRDPENDRLRYLWPLTYTRPTMGQRLSAAIPFLYTRVGNKNVSSTKAPPPAMDLAAPDAEVWENLLWTALQNVLLDPYGMPIKASSRSYRRNISDYRRSQIIRALSVLSLYQAVKGPSPFSDSEITEIQARLLLTDQTFGGLVDDLNLQRYYERQLVGVRDNRGHNWELLRQRAEAESLYFEPLQMPDGSMTHALLWIAKPDLSVPREQSYNKRFLNISDPWSDKRLLGWHGYTETRYFDQENRCVSRDTPGAKSVEKIPLALYGLDNPKIPALLVDFRDGLNPKKREMSRRVLQDITRNVLSLSRFGNLPYFLGRTIFDFVTGRRGIDMNQPSRLRTYSQLKLLLALNDSLNPDLRDEITHRLEKVSLNPLENDLAAEASVARQQYKALLEYAKQSDGLPAILDRDRREEMVPLGHGKTKQILFRLANILSFGKYTHREAPSPEMETRLDIARRLSYHTRFLQIVSRSSGQTDVAWNLDEVKHSLQFIAQYGSQASSGAVSASARIFMRTTDMETRRQCLETLSRITNPKARNELLRISANEELELSWKDLIGSYLSETQRGEPLSAAGGKTTQTRSGQ